MQTLKYKNPVSCRFVLENSGKSSLVIHDIRISCVCTVLELSKNIATLSNKNNIIEKCDMSHYDRLNKSVLIFYNGPQSPTKLTIKGEVKSPDDDQV